MTSEFSRDPQRLREQSGSVLERALLEAGVSYRAGAQTRGKALAALGLAGSTAILSGSASAGTLSSAAKLALSKMVAAVSLAGAVVAVPVGYYAWQRHQVPATAPLFNQPAVARAPAPPALNITAPTAAAAQPEPSPPVAATSMVPRRVWGARAARASRLDSRGSTSAATLTRELVVLDAARAALGAGKAASALSLLAGYSRDFPHGRLEIEAEVLRIDALASSGRGSAARKRAAEFVRRYPDSVFAERVRGFLDL